MIMTDYDKRNNVAIKAAAAPTFSDTPWTKADMGPTLEADTFTTRKNRADPPKDAKPAQTMKQRVMAVIGPIRHLKGKVALIRVEVDRAGKPPATSSSVEPSHEAWQVMYQASPKAAWRMWQGFTTEPGALPASLTTSKDPTPTPAQVDASQELPQQLIDSVRAEPGAPYAKSKVLTEVMSRMWVGGKADSHQDRTIQCEPYAPAGSADQQNALMLGQAKGAVVNVVSLRCRVDFAADEGWQFEMPKGTATVYKVPTKGTQVTFTRVLSGLFVTPKNGVSVLKSVSEDIVPPD